MLPRALLGAVVLAAVGCGPSLGEPTLAEPALYDTLAERCGSTDPIQLLALAPNETVESADPWYLDDVGYTSVARHGARWLLGVKTFEHEFIPPSIDPEENDPNELVSSRIVSVDGCGGDVRVVLEGTYRMRVPTGDEPWVACNEGMVAFDPDVEGSGRAHPDLYCSTDTISGVFAALTHPDEDEVGEQWLARARLAVYEPSDITPLAPHVYQPHVVEGTSRRMFDTREYEVIEIDVLTGQQNVLRTNVQSWSASADGRFLAWRQRFDGCGPLLLWDREIDEERLLGLPEWEDCADTYGIRGNAVAVTPYYNEPDVTQLVMFATGDEVLLEGQWWSDGQIGDTYVLRELGGGSRLMFVEPGGTPSPPIHVGVGDVYFRNIVGESLWMLVDEFVEDVDDDFTTPSSHSLYELAAPDFMPRLVASELLHPLRLADGRVLDVTDRDHEHRRGTLVLVDGQQSSVALDYDVADTLYRFNTSGQRDLLAPLVDDTLVYSVRDPEQERTGVWIAQLAPIAEP